MASFKPPPPAFLSQDHPHLLISKEPRTSRVQIYGDRVNLAGFEEGRLGLFGSVKRNQALKLEASRESPISTQERSIKKMESVEDHKTENQPDVFAEMKKRFLSFKKNKYMEMLDHYQKLAKGQEPKFMVIACGDSRVCPTSILGFQPGEAFIVRNVANLVPPLENGPTETNAALEFAVNALQVENLFVIGHSCCGGIRALMSMKDDEDHSSTFIKNWVILGKHAKSKTEEACTSDLSFDQKCKHCEKESVNRSLMNLLSYPWIEERVCRGLLSIHGGYYDFTDCTFEKWTLDYHGIKRAEDGDKYSIKDRAFWS